MDHVSKSFPQRFPPTPPSQSSSLRSEEVLNPDLDLQVRKRVVRSTGLVSRQWMPWHCNAVASLGPQTYLDIVDEAKRGKEPKTLLSWLLKEALEEIRDGR